MLRYALMAIAAAIVVAFVFVMLPVTRGPRPEPRLLASGDAAPATNFTVRDATPIPTPAPAAAPQATPAPAEDLDAVMQRLRNGGTKPDATATAAATAPAVAPPVPAVPPAPVPPVPAPADPVAAPAPVRWGSVTAQGTRWRMARSGNGYTVSIDLGGGKVADIHVLPAFVNLDPAAVNVRVDYLKDTILQNFAAQSGDYSFARDGSVSLQH